MKTLNELLQAASSGDSSAQNELLQRFLPRVSSLAHQQLQRRRGANSAVQMLSTGDVVQDVFLEVLRGIDRWEADEEQPFVAMLATLVEHRLIDHIRKEQAARRDARRHDDRGPQTLGVLDDERGPATIVMDREQVRVYREVLASFDDRQRALLALRLEDELEFQDLADRLAFPSADAARKAFRTAQARLLLRLQQRGIQPGGTL